MDVGRVKAAFAGIVETELESALERNIKYFQISNMEEISRQNSGAGILSPDTYAMVERT